MIVVGGVVFSYCMYIVFNREPHFRQGCDLNVPTQLVQIKSMFTVFRLSLTKCVSSSQVTERID